MRLVEVIGTALPVGLLTTSSGMVPVDPGNLQQETQIWQPADTLRTAPWRAWQHQIGEGPMLHNAHKPSRLLRSMRLCW